MDILKNLEIYIGKDEFGKTVLLANKERTEEFLSELNSLNEIKRV